MAFHPRSDAIILAAGDKGGRLGIWHLDHDSFEVHDSHTVTDNLSLNAHHGLSELKIEHFRMLSDLESYRKPMLSAHFRCMMTGRHCCPHSIVVAVGRSSTFVH